MTKVNSNGDTENHVHNFESVIGRSDGPMIDLKNCDRFRTLVLGNGISIRYDTIIDIE